MFLKAYDSRKELNSELNLTYLNVLPIVLLGHRLEGINSAEIC